ncbi:taperin [Amblyraja radiata]|uniref:taperin n=1 Tax=Amblyraja radiata TaxID=386614 RepID=UPI0014039ADA|nr:taperin [Amblyraja radiata]
MSLSEQRPLPRALEPGPEAQAMGRMPAWKREILERRKAKQASPGWERARAGSAPHGGGWTQGPSRELGEEEVDGGAVLLENIAPVQENLFIKRERWQRRREEREPAGLGLGSGPGRSVPQLLELYSQIPGVRTIRADNIIIIESDPDYFSEVGLRHDDSSRLNEAGVAEIRAAEVFVYEAPLSRSEENLSTLGTEGSGHLHGKVSRLLEKFDQNYVKPARSRSTENLLDGISAKERQSKPLLLPKPLVLTKHNPGPVRPDPHSTAWGSSHSELARSPDPDSAAPSHPKSSPLFSPTRYSAPLSPGRMPSLSHVALKDQDTSISEDRSYSVSSYRKQFEGMHADGWQKQSLVRKVPSHKSNQNTLKDCADKENKVMENGHPEVDFVGNDVHLVKEGEHQANASHVANGEVSPLQTSSMEVSKGADKWRPKYEVDARKSLKSCPDAPPPTVSDGYYVPSSVNPSAIPLGKVKQNHKVEGSAKVTPNQCNGVSASTSLNNSFEIIPATPPDFASIPEDDIQARALANLKNQSKNSFVVIPKKRAEASVTYLDVCNSWETSNKSDEEPNPDISASIPTEIQTDIISAISQEISSPSDCDQGKEEMLSDAESSPSHADFDMDNFNKPTSMGSYSIASRHTSFSPGEETSSILPTELPEAEQNDETSVTLIRKGDLPVTNIDDILDTEEILKQPAIAKPTVKKDKPSDKSFGEPQHLFMQRKSGNTFTVVPQRKPANTGQEAPVDTNGTAEQLVEDLDPAFVKLEVLLKKRYPAAEDIQVIGGYLSLERSCLSKNGSTRKKMKISFNDSSLHTTFEYPSESSLIQEDDSDGSEDDEEERPLTTFFPRPSYTSSPTSTSSPMHSNTVTSALSSYTPKHTMPFDTWQEQKLNEPFSSRDSSMQGGESTTEDNMLTPTDNSRHSDYSSEPALYF